MNWNRFRAACLMVGMGLGYQASTNPPLQQRGPSSGATRRPASVRVVASWYGKAHHGRATASGEAFDRWALTCAHKTLALGSWVRLREPRSQRVCLARVTDRGPYTKGRDLDVSEAVARARGIEERGVVTLEMEVVSAS